jgi:hypothetical protein
LISGWSTTHKGTASSFAKVHYSIKKPALKKEPVSSTTKQVFCQSKTGAITPINGGGGGSTPPAIDRSDESEITKGAFEGIFDGVLQ